MPNEILTTEFFRTSGYRAEPRYWAVNNDTPQDEQALTMLEAMRVQALFQDSQAVVSLDLFETKIRGAISRAHEEYLCR